MQPVWCTASHRADANHCVRMMEDIVNGSILMCKHVKLKPRLLVQTEPVS